MNNLTTLAKNIKNLRKANNFTQETLGTECGVSGSAVSQWESSSPTQPEVDHLLTMAGLFKVTVEQLVLSDDLEPASTLSSELNNQTLEKVFILLDRHPAIDKLLSTSNTKKRTYMFGLVYALCEDMDINDLAETGGLMELIGLSAKDESQNEPTKKDSRAVSTKRGTRKH